MKKSSLKINHVVLFHVVNDFGWLDVIFVFLADELFSVKLKELGPSSVDAEFRCLGPESGGDFALMKNILDFFIVQLKQRKDFELVQGYIALFLKVCYF